MDRRSFLSLTLGSLALPSLGMAFPQRKKPFLGWIPNRYTSSKENGTKRFYYLCKESGFDAKDFGKNKVACHYKSFEAVTGYPWLAHDQVTGDCVAQATGSAVDMLTCTRIVQDKKREKWIGKSSTDMIYSGGRNFYGNTNGQGMWGWWAMKYLKNYGNLIRQPYPPYNLTEYTRETVRHWDQQGIPDSLLTKAKEHPVLDYALVFSVEELRDAIVAGHPAVLCMSMGGENNQLDNDGFLKPSGEWMHAWLAAGVDDNPKRPGILLINSHSINWGQGPRHLDNPPGSAWVDFEIIDRQLKYWGDSHVLSDYRGFKKPDRDYIIW